MSSFRAGRPGRLAGHVRWAVPIIVVLLLWEAASALVLASGTALPQLKLPFPHRIVTVGLREWQMLTEGIFATARGAVLGLLAGTALGVAIALMVVQARRIEHTIYPYVIAGQMIPTIALGPILLTAMQNQTMARVAVATYITFFPVSLGMLKGLKSVDRDELQLLDSYDASWIQRYAKLRIPAAMPYFFAGLKVAAPLSVVGQIAVELAGATSGLGYLLLITQYYGPRFVYVFWAAMLVTLFLGYLFFLLAAQAERRLTGWQHEFRS